MWRHSLSSRTGQAPRPSVIQPWRHVDNLPFLQAKRHNLSITGTIEVPGFGWLEPRILGCSSFEGRNQLTEVGPIHFEEDFQFIHSKDIHPKITSRFCRYLCFIYYIFNMYHIFIGYTSSMFYVLGLFLKSDFFFLFYKLVGRHLK